MEHEDIYQKAIEYFGIDNQKLKAIEEMAELTNALIHLRDGRCEEQDVITEIADVTIMMQQLAIFFGKEKVENEILRKVYRLNHRIEDMAYGQVNM